MLPIIICGSSASGKTTTCREIARLLDIAPDAQASAGKIFRRIADDWGMDMAKLRALADEDPSIDIAIDRRALVAVRLSGPAVADGRVLAWLAHREGIKAFKVLLTVTPDTAAARLANREGIGPIEAEHRIKDRDREDAKRLGALYRWHPEDTAYYDLVISTDSLTALEVAQRIITAASK